MPFEEVVPEVASMRRLMVAAAVALAGGAIPIAAAQQEGPLAQFSSQVQLVEVYATVTDDKGKVRLVRTPKATS